MAAAPPPAKGLGGSAWIRIGKSASEHGRTRYGQREGRQEGSHTAHWEQAANELREEEAGEPQQAGNDAATPLAAGSGSGDQSSALAPAAEPEASRGSAGTGGSTAGAPSKARRKKT